MYGGAYGLLRHEVPEVGLRVILLALPRVAVGLVELSPEESFHAPGDDDVAPGVVYVGVGY